MEVLRLGICCRKGCILRLQRHFNELLIDQLPVLRQLARVLDEMSLGIDGAAASGPAGGGAAASRLILEQVSCKYLFTSLSLCLKTSALHWLAASWDGSALIWVSFMLGQELTAQLSILSAQSQVL